MINAFEEGPFFDFINWLFEILISFSFLRMTLPQDVELWVGSVNSLRLKPGFYFQAYLAFTVFDFAAFFLNQESVD